jgi:hypothetical protein
MVVVTFVALTATAEMRLPAGCLGVIPARRRILLSRGIVVTRRATAGIALGLIRTVAIRAVLGVVSTHGITPLNEMGRDVSRDGLCNIEVSVSSAS